MHGTNNIKFITLGLICIIPASSYNFNNSKPSGNNTYHQLQNYFFPMPPHVLLNFRGFPAGCGDSVANF